MAASQNTTSESRFLAWFCDAAAAPAIDIARRAVPPALEIEVPCAPCAAAERVTCMPNSALRTIRRALPSGVSETSPAAIERDLGARAVRVTPEMLLGDAPALDVACIVHGG